MTASNDAVMTRIRIFSDNGASVLADGGDTVINNDRVRARASLLHHYSVRIAEP
jgi:hypothetical protein